MTRDFARLRATVVSCTVLRSLEEYEESEAHEYLEEH